MLRKFYNGIAVIIGLLWVTGIALQDGALLVTGLVLMIPVAGLFLYTEHKEKEE